MMKMMKLAMSCVFTVVLLVTNSFCANASEEIDYAKEPEEVKVEVNVKIEFSNEDAEVYKNAMIETLNSNKEDLINEILITTNESKEELLNSIVEQIDKIEIDSLFQQDGNTTSLIIPWSDMNVEIEGTEFDVTSEGVIDGELEDKTELAKVICTEENIDIMLTDISDQPLEAEIEEKEDSYAINYVVSFEDFAEGVIEMSNNMADATAQAVTCVYPAKVSVGTYVGAGVGQTKVYFDTNIVGCNKHDEDLSSITTLQFAAGNSDCAKSVKLGLLALADTTGIIKSYYSNSIYCVIEGMTSATGDNVENIYCNGKRKTGNHVNCSWFNGIGHSERFHYHKYS